MGLLRRIRNAGSNLKGWWKFKGPHFRFVFFTGIATGIVFLLFSHQVVEYTSSDTSCEACHVHPHATTSWKLSAHFGNNSGVVTHCVECHLPPKGTVNHYIQKARFGLKDIYGTLFKDISKLDWDAKSTVEEARRFTFDESCLACHQNMFPLNMSQKGVNAHREYLDNPEGKTCIQCHLEVGHYDPDLIHAKNTDFGEEFSDENREVYVHPATVTEFKNFTEYIPHSTVSFDMVAIPEGTFTLGSPDDEKLRNEDEGPQRLVKIPQFFMGKIEVSWDEYMAFFSQTGAEGKSETSV